MTEKHIGKQRRPRLALSLVLKPPAGIPKRRAAQRCSCPWCWKPTCTRTALSNQPVLRRVRINQCVRIIGGEERCENTPGTWRPVTAMIRLSKWLMSDRWVSESGRWAHRILMIMLSGRFFFFFFFFYLAELLWNQMEGYFDWFKDSYLQKSSQINTHTLFFPSVPLSLLLSIATRLQRAKINQSASSGVT